MDEDEYKQFRNWLMTVGKTKQKAYLYKLVEICDLMIYSGMRREELLGLKWGSFNFEKRTLTIEAVRVKTSQGDIYEKQTKNYPSYRVYTLTDRIAIMLQGIRERQQSLGLYNPDGFIFIWEENIRGNLGKEYKTDYVSRIFRLAIKSCELVEDKSLHFHNLRHSCCSIMFKIGFSKKETQDWIGHSDGSKVTDRVYNHYERPIDVDRIGKYDEVFR